MSDMHQSENPLIDGPEEVIQDFQISQQNPFLPTLLPDSVGGHTITQMQGAFAEAAPASADRQETLDIPSLIDDDTYTPQPLSFHQDEDRAYGAEEKLNVATSLYNLARSAYRQHEYDQARTFLEDCLPIYRELEDQKNISVVFNKLGKVAYRQGRYDDANAFYEQSQAVSREIEDLGTVALGYENKGKIAYRQGDYTGATALFKQSFNIYMDQGDKKGMAWSLNGIGKAAYRTHDYATARAQFEASLGLIRMGDDKQSIAWIIENLGKVTYQLADYNKAQELYREGLDINTELADQNGMAWSYNYLGRVAYRQEKYEEAHKFLKQSLEIFQYLDNPEAISECIERITLVNNALEHGGQLMLPFAPKEVQADLSAIVVVEPKALPEVIEPIITSSGRVIKMSNPIKTGPRGSNKFSLATA